MKILVTGAGGQLGRELVRYPKLADVEMIGFTRAEMDVTHLEAVREKLRAVRPDVVIHAAAYTKVDLAESCPVDVYRVNALGTRNVAVAAEEVGAKVCYISTDYVFDGQTDRPYNEYDNTNPLSVYGKSKRAGEILVQGLCSRWFIVRTSWVFGKYGPNFVKTILTKARAGEPLRVVADQHGSPTYTKDLARFLIDLVRTEAYGIYHATNQGQCSWYEFACAILEEAAVTTPIEPCTTDAFPRPAPRPKFSVLGQTMLLAAGFTPFRPWRDALQEFIGELEE